MSPLPSATACLVEAAGCWRRCLRLAACNLLVLSQAFAAPGDLDLGFGSGGKVTTGFGSTYDFGRSVAVQSDGKIIVVGYLGANYSLALVRYTATGALDASFGSSGKVTTAVGYSGSTGESVALQSDGKIVVAGGSGAFSVARYTAAGALDTSFGSGGRVTTSISFSDYGYSVAVQSDGKIVVAGRSDTNVGGPPVVGTDSRFALVRYTAVGALDASFGSGGTVITGISGTDDAGRSVAVQSDGKIVVAGEALNAFALVRYTATGALDASFGSGGKVTTNFGGGPDRGRSVAVQSDGKIVVAGRSRIGSQDAFALVRYTPAGALDASFGSGGKVTTAVGSSGGGENVALQRDGKIVVAGSSSNGSNIDFALVRYTAAGALDASFGSAGKVTTDFGSNTDDGYSVAVQRDGKIVVAGTSLNGTNYDFAVARYAGDGPTSSANWRLTYFGTMENSGDAADAAAPDGDGIANLIKYGLFIIPGSSGASSLPQGQRKVYAEGERLALVFLHDPARNDISIEVQAADHPDGPWTTVASSAGGAIFSGAGFVGETGTNGGFNIVEVRDIVNIDAAPHRYMHIKVTH